jgi:hypothetical protein
MISLSRLSATLLNVASVLWILLPYPSPNRPVIGGPKGVGRRRYGTDAAALSVHTTRSRGLFAEIPPS